MDLPVPDDLRSICGEIVAEGKSDEEWSEIEADDWFQTDTVHGGYDALERAFTFSYYPPEGGELWLQLTLEEAARVAAGELHVVDATPAEQGEAVSTACARAREVLSRVREFVGAEQQRVAPIHPEALERDARFMQFADEALRTCTPESLRALMTEIRGLSHYFCSYSPRLTELDPLLDDLYRAVRDGLEDGGA